MGHIKAGETHYVENVGDGDLIFLEVLQAPRLTDISVSQWLALTPRQIINDTLHLPDNVLDRFPKEKPIIVQGNRNLTALAGNGTASRVG